MKLIKVVIYQHSFSKVFGEIRKSFAWLWLALFFTVPILAQETVNRQDLKETRKQAEQFTKRGAFAEAELLWQKLVEADAKDDQARLGWSHSLLKQRKLEEAFIQAEEITKKPGNEKSNFVRCASETPNDFAPIGKPDPVLSANQDCPPQIVNRNAARAHALMGGALLGIGAFRRATTSFVISLGFNPNEALAIAGLGLIDFYENRTKDSLRKLRRAAFLNASEPDFIFALAQVAARTENYKEAADSYTKFLRIAPITDIDRRERIQGLVDFLRYLGNQKSIYDVGGAKFANVAFESTNNRPIIKVRLNDGKEELNFVLDTGSGMTVISEETAKRFNVKSVARGGKARAIGGIGKFDIVYGYVSSLHIGEVQVSNVPVYVRKFYTSGETIDGYIGLSVISKFLTTVDYGKKTFSLVRQKKNEKNKDETIAKDINQEQQIPLRLTSGGFLSGEVKIEGIEIPLNFIIDTGASISVVSMETAMNAEISRHLEETTMRVLGAAGVTENVASLMLPKVSLGKHSREKLQVAVLDLSPINETTGYEQAGILGGNFLLNYRVTFDFQKALVSFVPNQIVVKTAEKNANIGNLPIEQE